MKVAPHLDGFTLSAATWQNIARWAEPLGSWRFYLFHDGGEQADVH
jgi:hypothetical protein